MWTILIPLLLGGAPLLSLSEPVVAGGAVEISTIYVVRHAEKIDESRDTDLSQAGRRRAKVLARMLESVKFDAAYSTDLRRTRDTLAPLAKAQDFVPIINIAPNRQAATIVANHRGQTVIVAGHSNTVPQLLRDLGADFEPRLLDGYDDLFVVTLVHQDGKPSAARLMHLHYGPAN